MNDKFNLDPGLVDAILIEAVVLTQLNLESRNTESSTVIKSAFWLNGWNWN